jgi:hypothetical protein
MGVYDLSAVGSSYQRHKPFVPSYQLAVWLDMVPYIVEQRVFLYDTYMKYVSLESVGENFDVNFVMKEYPADKQFTIW